jgi:hypothetical protein
MESESFIVVVESPNVEDVDYRVKVKFDFEWENAEGDYSGAQNGWVISDIEAEPITPILSLDSWGEIEGEAQRIALIKLDQKLMESA